MNTDDNRNLDGSLETIRQKNGNLKNDYRKIVDMEDRWKRDNVSVNVFFLKKNTLKLENIQRYKLFKIRFEPKDW